MKEELNTTRGKVITSGIIIGAIASGIWLAFRRVPVITEDQVSEADSDKLFTDQMRQLEFDEGIISKKSLLSIMKENRKRLEARLTEENEIYVKERRKYFERDMDRYHDCIFDFVESMGEAINEISKEVLDVFGVQAEEFDRSVAAHFRDIEVQKMHK